MSCKNTILNLIIVFWNYIKLYFHFMIKHKYIVRSRKYKNIKRVTWLPRIKIFGSIPALWTKSISFPYSLQWSITGAIWIFIRSLRNLVRLTYMNTKLPYRRVVNFYSHWYIYVSMMIVNPNPFWFELIWLEFTSNDWYTLTVVMSPYYFRNQCYIQ